MKPTVLPRRSGARTALLAILTAVLAAATLVPAPAAEAQTPRPTPADPVWSSTYIDTPDGESLFVDVLHPADLPPEAGPRPVLMVVSPYLGDESGLDWTRRFADFFFGAYEGEGIFANGWSVVQVHMRGTSGSTGCLDILGPGEQMDIAAGVAWVDDQPWADGIAMYGKSYDANTGAAALAMRPAGLDAVIAQAIGPDRYRATHNDRVRLAQSLLYPSVTYGIGAEANFSTGSDATYIANSASRSADCQALLAEHYLEIEDLPFWRIRDFPDRAEGSTIPAFITAGYLDNATNIGGGALDLFNALAGPKHLWIGWWAHDRGNDTQGTCDQYVEDCTFLMGRDSWFAEATAFLERHVKGTPLADLPEYPDYTVAAQTSDGTWRHEDALPAADTLTVEMALRPGSYTDDGMGRGSADTGLGAGGLVRTGSLTDGIWTFGAPVAVRTHIAGVPVATIPVRPSLPRANVVVNLYDVGTDGRATMISRGAGMADLLGEEVIRMWPTDWVLEPGHRLAVRVHDANTENYVHVPSLATVDVIGGHVDLPVLPAARVSDAEGAPAPRLLTYRQRAPFDVSAILAAQGSGAALGLSRL
jgi:uncharacterized protein